MLHGFQKLNYNRIGDEMSDYEFDTDFFDFDKVYSEAENLHEILAETPDFSYITDYKAELEQAGHNEQISNSNHYRSNLFYLCRQFTGGLE